MLNLLLFVGLALTYPSLGQSEIFWMYKFYLCSKTKTTSVGFEPVNLGLTLGALTNWANEWGEIEISTFTLILSFSQTYA